MPVLGTAELLEFLEMEGILAPPTVNREDPISPSANQYLEEAIGETGATVRDPGRPAGMAPLPAPGETRQAGVGGTDGERRRGHPSDNVIS